MVHNGNRGKELAVFYYRLGAKDPVLNRERDNEVCDRPGLACGKNDSKKLAEVEVEEVNRGDE